MTSIRFPVRYSNKLHDNIKYLIRSAHFNAQINRKNNVMKLILFHFSSNMIAGKGRLSQKFNFKGVRSGLMSEPCSKIVFSKT